MEFTSRQTEIGVAAKIGGILFLLWAVLHIWVGLEGVQQYLSAGAMEQWNMLIGGVNAPRETPPAHDRYHDGSRSIATYCELLY